MIKRYFMVKLAFFSILNFNFLIHVSVTQIHKNSCRYSDLDWSKQYIDFSLPQELRKSDMQQLNKSLHEKPDKTTGETTLENVPLVLSW